MKYLLSTFLLLPFISCNSPAEDDSQAENDEEFYVPLPYIGFHDTELVSKDGVEKWDSIYHTVPPFELMNQDSLFINNSDVAGKIYVANFFFTSCPSICPAMIGQMKRFQDLTNDIEELSILSHTIDPERDSIPKLRKYIVDHEIDTRNWHLLYGDREYVHQLGVEGYMLNVMEDPEAEGGFFHSEYFALIDREGHIRGLYKGTETDQVDQLNDDIRKLIEHGYRD